ncbi:MAG: DUF4340 domain-containing protein [Planctomycetota bacterium]|nr:MAG: DUF4340 domain-containing protein [Planctomycetota bacterium]
MGRRTDRRRDESSAADRDRSRRLAGGDGGAAGEGDGLGPGRLPLPDPGGAGPAAGRHRSARAGADRQLRPVADRPGLRPGGRPHRLSGIGQPLLPLGPRPRARAVARGRDRGGPGPDLAGHGRARRRLRPRTLPRERRAAGAPGPQRPGTAFPGPGRRPARRLPVVLRRSGTAGGGPSDPLGRRARPARRGRRRRRLQQPGDRGRRPVPRAVRQSPARGQSGRLALPGGRAGRSPGARRPSAADPQLPPGGPGRGRRPRPGLGSGPARRAGRRGRTARAPDPTADLLGQRPGASLPGPAPGPRALRLPPRPRPSALAPGRRRGGNDVSRRNRILLLVLAASAALALAVEQPWRGDAFARTAAAASERLFPRLERERGRVERIEIRDPAGRGATLVRSGAGFVVEEKLSHPADRLRVDRLLAALAALTRSDVVSTNPTKQGVYGVDDATGTRLRVLDENGGVLADLVAGKLRSQDPRKLAGVRLEFYVRPAGRTEVLLVEELATPSTDPAAWLARRFFPVADEDLIEIERRDLAEGGADSWRIVRVAAEDDPATEEVEDHAWRMVEPREEPATLYAGDSWVFTFAGLGPADVAARLEAGRQPEDPKWGFTTNAYRARTADGRELVVYLGRPAGADQRYAWIPGLPWIYTITEHEAIELRMPVERMLRDD